MTRTIENDAPYMMPPLLPIPLGSGVALGLARVAGQSAPDGWFHPAAAETGICLHVHLNGARRHEMRDAGGRSEQGAVPIAATIAYALARKPLVRLEGDPDFIALHIPDAAVEVVARQSGMSGASLAIEKGRPFRDETIVSLVQTMLWAQENAESSGQFLTHIGFAVIARLLEKSSDARTPIIVKGGLAPWQMRRAQQMMDARLDSELCLTEVAQECGLSVSHFSRAFRRATGTPPHTWRVRRRLETAKTMMRTPELALSEIALACGFSDQSHFTRMFSREIGTTPGAWRRGLAI